MTELLPDDARVMPTETVPDSWCGLHPVLCACAPCARRPPELLRKLRRRAPGQTTISSSASTVSS